MSDQDWFGEPKYVHCGSVRAGLPFVPMLAPTVTLSVGELIALLKKEDPMAPVGTTTSSIHGHVTGFFRLTHDEFGMVILDQGETCIYSGEVGINSREEEVGIKKKWLEAARMKGWPQSDLEDFFYEARRSGGRGTT